jgi:hypothetical protein
VTKILEKGLKVFIVRVDPRCAPSMRGTYHGATVDQGGEAARPARPL